ncbi:MAG: SDR family NAD(P)-dependent oxidoreductase [Acidimicrobiales bacterium]|nr:SDR family NAD(P)-dependent oxidoreductase [Acidimicrobiales bacterium]
MDIENKRIIVTGCASGMGAATIRAYAGAGANVVGMDIVAEAGTEVCTQADVTSSGSAVFLPVDVADFDSVQKAFADAVAHLGGLDVLAHPAAVHQASDTAEIRVEDWDWIFGINVRGTMLTNQAAYPHIKEAGGGAIINFGSISGQRPESTSAAYSATKGAVHAWTRSAAGSWGADNIRVNAILPAIATPMHKKAWEDSDEAEQTRKFWRNMEGISLGQKYGDPDEDLGPVMVFLASDASHFITGQLIPVDGGQGNVR